MGVGAISATSASAGFGLRPLWAKPRQANPIVTTQTPNSPTTRQRLKHVGLAAGLFGLGLLTHKLPALSRPGANLLSSDWKAWARAGLGVATVSQINQSANIRPPSWALGLESVAIIHPLAMGFAAKTGKQMLVIGPLVAAIAEGVHLANAAITRAMPDDTKLPKWVPRLGLTLGTMALALTALPRLYKQIARVPWFSEAFKKVGNTAAIGAMTCPRGCTVGGVICLSELGEFASSLGSKVYNRLPFTSPSSRKGGVSLDAN